MWLAIHDGAITLGVSSLHEDMTKLISVRGRTLQLEHRLLISISGTPAAAIYDTLLSRVAFIIDYIKKEIFELYRFGQ